MGPDEPAEMRHETKKRPTDPRFHPGSQRRCTVILRANTPSGLASPEQFPLRFSETETSPGSPGVKTSPSKAGGVGSVPGVPMRSLVRKL